MKIEIPDEPKIVINSLIKAGFEAGIVGGCVRDTLMKQTPNDWDICTSATPNEIINTFTNYKILTIGLKHGTITVIINHQQIEITTYRIDGKYTDKRRPDSVKFTKNLILDLSRRDFTQNAIFYNDLVGFIDPFNGIDDIENKTIKCVGKADKRFKEDALRILRALRFSSTLGFQIEPETKTAIFENVELLDNISKERIAEEFVKLLSGKNASNVLKEYQNIIAYIIPEIKASFNFKQKTKYHMYDVWTHTLKAIDATNEPLLKVVMFFHDIGKPDSFSLDSKNICHFYGHAKKSYDKTKKIFKRLHLSSVQSFSKNDIKDILTLIKYHDLRFKPEKKPIKKVLYLLNGQHSLFEQLIQVMIADTMAKNTNIIPEKLLEIQKIQKIHAEIKKNNECLSLKQLKVSGQDMINIGYENKDIGNILHKILTKVIEDKLKNEKNELLRFATEYYNKK